MNNTNVHTRLMRACTPKPSGCPGNFGASRLFVCSETVVLVNLEHLASRKAADTFAVIFNEGKDDEYTGDTLSRELYKIKLRVNKRSEGMTTIWHEETLAHLAKRPLRRYSGMKGPENLEGLHCEERILDLQRRTGVTLYDLTKAGFALPGWLRDALRGGGCDVDQCSAALMAQFARHPNKPVLKAYLCDINGHLARIPAGNGNIKKKKLIRGLIYTGGRPHTQEWRTKAGVSIDDLPPFVWEFMREQRTIMREDAGNNPDLVERLRKAGYGKPQVQCKVVLNEAYERLVTDKQQIAAEPFGEATSFEHDGVWIDCDEADREELLSTCEAIAPIDIEAPRSMDEILAHLKSQSADGGLGERGRGFGIHRGRSSRNTARRHAKRPDSACSWPRSSLHSSFRSRSSGALTR